LVAAGEGDLDGDIAGDPEGDIAGDIAGDSTGAEGDAAGSEPPQAVKGNSKTETERRAKSLLFIERLIEQQWK
jgi:hypothetical protein